MTTTAARGTEFDVEVSSESLGYSFPQQVGRRLSLPMLAMALMAFAVGIILAIVRAGEISDGGDADTIASLGHLVPAFMFIGFASVFAAISFSIARILGQFRKGGGEVQETVTATVKTLKMPVTAKLFLAIMMMAMMTILLTVAVHFFYAIDVEATASSLEDSEKAAVVLEGIRRTGVAMYLFAVLLGLATIIRVLRFQAIRIRELPQEAGR